MTNSLTTKVLSAVIAVAATTMTFAEVTHARPLEFAYSPAELETPAGAADLDKRLHRFSRIACRGTSAFRPPVLRKKCRVDIEAQVWRQINDLDTSASQE